MRKLHIGTSGGCKLCRQTPLIDDAFVFHIQAVVVSGEYNHHPALAPVLEALSNTLDDYAGQVCVKCTHELRYTAKKLSKDPQNHA